MAENRPDPPEMKPSCRAKTQCRAKALQKNTARAGKKTPCRPPCRENEGYAMEIYGTLGPSCGSREVLADMFRAGMTGIRLNLSHVTLRESRSVLDEYHAAAQAAGVRTPDLLVDMQGPELRIGRLPGKLVLREGTEVCLCRPEDCFGQETDRPGEDGNAAGRAQDCAGPGEQDAGRCVIPIPPQVLTALRPGPRLLLDDGKILLQVTGEGRAEVLRGGDLISRKSLAVSDPGAPEKSTAELLPGLRLPAVTLQDRENLRNAVSCGVTGIMQPFVRDAEDLKELRQAMEEAGAGHLRIFAKIENRAGAEHLEQLLPEADVIVIARGDLGNAYPLWELPGVQKDIAAACRNAGKPFLVVTQMLASMENNPVPTRAEVSDIFNAVLDGAQAVMITGESAVGKYPAEAVRYLADTAHAAEEFRRKRWN